MRYAINQPIRSGDWQALRVWIIGASTGIGAALAVQLSALGARIILSGRNSENLRLVANKCRANTDRESHIIPFDVSDNHSISMAVSEVNTIWQGVDLVIYNAGTYESTRVDTLSPESAEQSLRVNLIAPIALTAAALPLLTCSSEDTKPRGLAYVASVAGYRGLPRALTYGPGKAGLISFAESLWVDLKGLGLNTWIINPGFVRTRLTAQNTFAMPALIEPEEAATSIIRGFAKGNFEIHFPARFSWFMKLLRVLPINWYLRLSKRLVPSLSNTQLTSKPPSKME
ncbi:MAG: SDR family NAD(P)-dependent oxidoreductase [Fluviibacter sp.]